MFVCGEAQHALSPPQGEEERRQEGKKKVDQTDREPKPGEGLADHARAAHFNHLEASLWSQV